MSFILSKRFLLALALIFLSQLSFGFDHNHSKWEKILEKNLHVSGHQSLINYKNIANSPKELNLYTQELTEVTKEQFDSFNKKQQLAFLINAYNAFTVQFIVKNYPVESIKDLGSLFRSPWKKRFFKLFGKKTHLDNVEHDMIRKWFQEPRIHFAVVCASLGCPPLALKPFTEDNLEILLEKQSRNFIQDPKENFIRNGRIYLSKIFKWYGDDFETDQGNFLSFVAQRITKDKETQKRIINGDIPTSWNNYDWKLNNYILQN